MVHKAAVVLVVTALQQLSAATSITDIQGPAYLSPLKGQTVHDVTGVVTAKVRRGVDHCFQRSSDR